MKFRLISAFAALAVLAAPVLLATPASASNGPPVVGCTTGSSCMVELNYLVTYTGSSGGSNNVVVTPPPCIGLPAGDAHTGSQAIISLYGNTAPVPSPTTVSPTAAPSSASPSPGSSSASPSPSPSASAASPPAPTLPAQEQQILNQAKQLVKSNPIAAGEWYQISGDPYATAAAQQVCSDLPPYVWVPGGGRLPRLRGLNIPVRTLAELAYSQLTTAQLGKVTLNPKGMSDTNLPTFVDVALRQPAGGVLAVAGGGNPNVRVGTPYVWATAATPNGKSATVWAWATGLNIQPGTSNATTTNDQRCSVAHAGGRNGHELILGSRYSKAAMAQVGAGQPIDCGVTYTAPGTYDLTVSAGWDACWAPGLATGDGPPANCKAVPGAGGLQDSTTGPVAVNVREIQSVNG
jgi:hypothetical protein